MVAFPETEPMTIKRIEVALRNKDMYLLQEAANKLHEKYHMGFSFTMFDELSQIKNYIENNEIPTEIKDVLCPVIDGILSSAGKEVSEYKIDEEKEREKEEIKRNYDYNFGNPTNDYSLNSEQSETENEQNNFSSDENQPLNETADVQNNQDYGENSSNNDYEENRQQSLDFSGENNSYEEQKEQENFEQNETIYETEVQNPEEHKEEPYEDYQENHSQETLEQDNQNPVNEQTEYTEYNPEEEHKENREEISYNEQKEENASEEETHEKPDDVAIFYYSTSSKDESYAIRDYRQKLNFINSNLYSKQPVNLLEKISAVMDIVDVKDGICDFLLGISKTKSKKTFITTSINQNITNYLANNNVKFQIPMVQNTYSNESSLDIIPIFGATNLFVCKKCGSMFLNTGSYVKVLSLGCPECDSISYPNVFDSNDVECNSIFLQRAYFAMAESKTWVIINPPKADENEGITDFLRVTFKSSSPKKIYIYAKDKTYENIINQYNKDVQIMSFDSLEALYNELMNNKEI